MREINQQVNKISIHNDLSKDGIFTLQGTLETSLEGELEGELEGWPFKDLPSRLQGWGARSVGPQEWEPRRREPKPGKSGAPKGEAPNFTFFLSLSLASKFSAWSKSRKWTKAKS